jgi:hypothetical protein
MAVPSVVQSHPIQPNQQQPATTTTPAFLDLVPPLFLLLLVEDIVLPFFLLLLVEDIVNGDDNE